MKSRRAMAGLAAWVGLGLMAGVAMAGEGRYHSGGAARLPAAAQAVLDRNAEILTLGINADWLAEDGVDPGPFSEAIGLVADMARAGRIPGAVIYVGRGKTDVMPVGIGWRMTDPQRWPVLHDTEYYVEDLTGALLTVPLVLNAVTMGELRMEDAVGDVLPPLAGSPLGSVTVEQLLRHTSGLPVEAPAGIAVATRADMRGALAGLELEPAGRRVRKSPLNFVVLGLLLEARIGKPYSAIVKERILDPFNLRKNPLDTEPQARGRIAPGHYDAGLGRMVWAEPSEPFGIVLGEDAPHTGLVISADQMQGIVRGLMILAGLAVGPDGVALSPAGRAFVPDPSAEGGESMGAGFELGALGPGSFGWDGLGGCSFWAAPARNGVVIYLSNPGHMAGTLGEQWDDPRRQVMPLLDAALGVAIDTGRGSGEAEPAGEHGGGADQAP